MIDKSPDGTLRIALSPECTIADVEAHADRLRLLIVDVSSVQLHADALEELDTAYLQLLLSLKATMDDMGVPFSLRGLSRVLDDALDLYGIVNI